MSPQGGRRGGRASDDGVAHATGVVRAHGDWTGQTALARSYNLQAREPSKAFYVTTPIYYVNDAPHIGHAYTTVAGDVLTRWHRQRGEDVWFLTGTDEHGEKVLRSAEANGVDPAGVDRPARRGRLAAGAGRPSTSPTTTSSGPPSRATPSGCRQFLQGLYDKGEIYEGEYEGPYCVRLRGVQAARRPARGRGRVRRSAGVRRSTAARSSSCQRDELVLPALERTPTRLLEHYEANPDCGASRESARNEVVSFVRSGLQDLSISRSTFDWGIPVPWDPEQVVYVWFDALLELRDRRRARRRRGPGAAQFAPTWPADVHLVGKDILRFHAVIWPAMLMAAGLPLPRKVFAHGWLLVGGEKMSKSKLTGIAPAQITDHFGSDAFRYYFLRAIQFGSDGSFSWEDMTARYTSELANGLGNLASRVAAMVGRYFDGVLPGR